MGWKGWLLGGSDEVGWEDLVARVVEAVASVGQFGARGRPAFPPELEVHVTVPEGHVELARSFVEKAEFDRQVQAALANRCDCPENLLPLRSYRVTAGARPTVTVRECPREGTWELAVDGGDLHGQQLLVPAAKTELRFGRGEWHGGDRQLRNDLIISRDAEFVSRRAGRLLRLGGLLEVESLDQGDFLLVHRAATGEVIRPSRTGSGRLALKEGDALELTDGKGQALRLVVRRRGG